jgi:hypothetical protein
MAAVLLKLRIGDLRPRATQRTIPIQTLVARCEEDYELGINKRAAMLKLLMRQFLTQKSVF